MVEFSKEFDEEGTFFLIYPELKEHYATPTTISKKFQFCFQCRTVKPERAHHCSTCGRCWLKMEHHCRWVDNCVSYGNHKFFFMFLVYGNILSWMSMALFIHGFIDSFMPAGGFYLVINYP